jgi:histidinol dehydrogenase
VIEIIRPKEGEKRHNRLRLLRERSVVFDADLMSTVAGIMGYVRQRGDAALLYYTKRFDGVELDQSRLRVTEEGLRRAASHVDPYVLKALREAIRRVRAFHEFERQHSWDREDASGVRLGQRVRPIERAGLYVPGGTAGYPSSVIMNVVPARVAGVQAIAVATPPQSLEKNPAVAAALLELEVTEVYAMGGAQAIAALAYGTESVARVDKITGPGNRYVAAAKKLVFGAVGIDLIAGPTEVVIIADETARASFVAADLLAQAEHAEDASAVLLTTSEKLALGVREQLAAQALTLPRRTIVEKSLAQYGAIILVETVDEACRIANEIAPEHVEIMARDEEQVASQIHSAGAIFMGAHTPEAVGDYWAGPNHVLPTAGAARFQSALSVYDFLKRTSFLKYSQEEIRRRSPMIAALARAEGLEAHARSVTIRAEA